MSFLSDNSLPHGREFIPVGFFHIFRILPKIRNHISAVFGKDMVAADHSVKKEKEV